MTTANASRSPATSAGTGPLHGVSGNDVIGSPLGAEVGGIPRAGPGGMPEMGAPGRLRYGTVIHVESAAPPSFRIGDQPVTGESQGIGLSLIRAKNLSGNLPANRHDSKLLELTLDARVLLPPVTSRHLCLDNGYDFPFCREIVMAYQFTPHIRPVGEEPRRMNRNRKRRARRWVVERTLGWFNRCRRLLIRWEKKVENHLAFLSLACVWIIHRAIARSFGSAGAL